MAKPLIRHERAFVQSVARRLWVIEGQRLIETVDPAPVFARLMAG